jgi:hypothetical protein
MLAGMPLITDSELPDIPFGAIVRYDGLTPDDEGNHLLQESTWGHMTGKEYLYLGLHPNERFAQLGICRLWVPEFGNGGQAHEVAIREITVVALPYPVRVMTGGSQ